MSVTMWRSSPMNALMSEDLPTFGRPTIANFGMLSSAVVVLLGHVVHYLVEEVACPGAVGCGDFERVAQAECVELCHVVARVADVLFVGDYDYGLFRAAEYRCHMVVEVCDAVGGVDDE